MGECLTLDVQRGLSVNPIATMGIRSAEKQEGEPLAALSLARFQGYLQLLFTLKISEQQMDEKVCFVKKWSSI